MNSAGDRIVVGANLANVGGSGDAGKVYVYVSSSGTGWVQQGAGGNPFISASDTIANGNVSHFGQAVSINANGDRIVVGTPGANISGNSYGKAYVYAKQNPNIFLNGLDNSVYIDSSVEIVSDGTSSWWTI